MKALRNRRFRAGVGPAVAIGLQVIGCAGGSSAVAVPDASVGPDSSTTVLDSGGANIPPVVGVATGCVGPFDIAINANSSPPGYGIIRGSVTFAQPIALKSVQILLGPNQWLTSSTAGMGQGTTLKQTVTFEIKGLQAFKYYLQVVVDTNGDGQFTAGDLGGFWDGTLGQAAPPWQAKEITVTLAGETCADFGVGPLPCYVPWGQACMLIAECAPTVCDCGRALTKRTTNACDGATRVCRRADGDCSSACGPSGTATERQSNCLGR